MKQNKALLISLIILFTAYGCATHDPNLVPVEDLTKVNPDLKDTGNASVGSTSSSSSTSENKNAPVPKASPSKTPSKKASGNYKDNAAVSDLIKEADAYASKARYDKTAEVIERALRIEPNNALLWQKLAVTRIQHGKWQEGINLAEKSNSLAGNDVGLKNKNWEIIGLGHEALGAMDKADAARANIR